jgi:hypothetical protein
MDIVSRFCEIQNTKIITICDLNLHTDFNVVYASKVNTKFGLSILLTLRKNSEQALKIYLPRRFNPAFKDEDITCINNGQIALIFTYRDYRKEGIWCEFKNKITVTKKYVVLW